MILLEIGTWGNLHLEKFDYVMLFYELLNTYNHEVHWNSNNLSTEME